MGCCSSKDSFNYDQIPQKTTDFESVILYNKRKPYENEIQDIAESIAIEPFAKDRELKLRKLDGVEIDKNDIHMILRALKNDNEKIDFIKKYRNNFTNVQSADIIPFVRSKEKKKEIENLYS